MNNEYEHIDDSKLKFLPTSGGFATPDDYFEQSRNAILARVLASEANPQQLNDAYFEESRVRILQKTTERSSHTHPGVAWYKKSFVQYAAAALVVCSISIGFWFNQKTTPSYTMANVSDEEILQYLQQTDLRDISINEVSFASTEFRITEEETYIINHTDEQTLLEEL